MRRLATCVIAPLAIALAAVFGAPAIASAAPAATVTTVSVASSAQKPSVNNWRYTTKSWSEYRNLLGVGGGKCLMVRADITATYHFKREVYRKSLVGPAFTGHCSNLWWR